MDRRRLRRPGMDQSRAPVSGEVAGDRRHPAGDPCRATPPAQRPVPPPAPASPPRSRRAGRRSGDRRASRPASARFRPRRAGSSPPHRLPPARAAASRSRGRRRRWPGAPSRKSLSIARITSARSTCRTVSTRRPKARTAPAPPRCRVPRPPTGASAVPGSGCRSPSICGRQRRRCHRAGEDAQTAALPPRRDQRGHESVDAGDVPPRKHRLRPVRIVEIEDAGLDDAVGGAQARRMVGVAFDLDRTAHLVGQQHAVGIAAARDRGCEGPRHAGDKSRRHLDIRNGLFRHRRPARRRSSPPSAKDAPISSRKPPAPELDLVQRRQARETPAEASPANSGSAASSSRLRHNSRPALSFSRRARSAAIVVHRWHTEQSDRVAGWISYAARSCSPGGVSGVRFQFGLKTSSRGRRLGAGSRWQSRHQLMDRLARLPGQRHAVDRAVAGHAADAFGDMDAVIEEDVVRQLVDAVPADRLALAPGFAAPAPAFPRWSRSASGRSCRYGSAAARRLAETSTEVWQ